MTEQALHANLLLRLALACLMSMILVAGCAQDNHKVTEDPTATQSASLEPAPAVSTPTAGPDINKALPKDARREALRPVAQRTTDAGTLGLVGVQRLSDHVVAVVAVLTPAQGGDLDALTEPGEGADGVGDFSAVTLNVGGAGRVEMVMRTERGDCLCSPLRQPLAAAQTPVYALFALPAGEPDQAPPSVTVTVQGFEPFTEVPVTVPVPGTRSPFGTQENIAILSALRADGTISVTARLENPGTSPDRRSRGVYDPAFLSDAGPCFRGLTVLGSNGRVAGVVSEIGCQRGLLPTAGKYVDLEVTMGDPGGEELTFLPTLGVPITGVQHRGPRVPGTRDVLAGVERYRLGPLEVALGEEVRIRIPLDAVVDAEGAPTPDLAAIVAQVTDLAASREGRLLAVTVHSGHDGTPAEQVAATKAQATLLVDLLRPSLGEGWLVTGAGVGASQPRAMAGPTGTTPEQLAALNSRVDIVVRAG